MEKAFFGLIGVVLGVFLTVAKEWWFQSRKNQKEIEYLSIQIVCMLERFIEGCVEVISDDGTYQGQYDSDGSRFPSVSRPKFEPGLVQVEWKSLPAHLMYEILNFPSLIEAADNKIKNVFEYAAFPPDYDEGFEEREYQYSILGIKASILASKLRKISKLPEREIIDDWDSIKILNEVKHKIEVIRNKRNDEHSKMLDNINTSKVS